MCKKDIFFFSASMGLLFAGAIIPISYANAEDSQSLYSCNRSQANPDLCGKTWNYNQLSGRLNDEEDNKRLREKARTEEFQRNNAHDNGFSDVEDMKAEFDRNFGNHGGFDRGGLGSRRAIGAGRVGIRR